jgi:vacuolar-type H+-ATPase subunit D/Vma8
MTSTTPANRATRLHVRGRLDLARHAIELLRNKEETLQREHTRLKGHADRTEVVWRERVEQAAIWLLRARALGASGELGEATGSPAEATIDVAWRTSMGVTYPGSTHCTPSAPPRLRTSAALVPTADAFRAALHSAAQHAAARTALARVRAELAHTRRRRRALEKRLVVRLEADLHQLDLALDERDRESALRTQLAMKRR